MDAINQRYEFLYDALGRLTQEKKGTATKSFAYDAAGNRTQRTDFNGASTNYTFDALNRLTTIAYPDTTSATYGYDVLSRLTTASNPNGTVTIGYDNRGRVSSVTDVFGQVVGYAYDANSNRTQLSLNGATNTTYQYDVLNRLTQLADAASLNTALGYDATDKLTSRNLPNGVATSYQYDGLDRLTRLTHAKGANTLADFQYQFNAVNNITQMIDSAGTQSFTYDSVDRLASATHTGQANESYSYDAVGNRTSSHLSSNYAYQPFNRLTSSGGASYTYDNNGNLSSKTEGAAVSQYTWDSENRLAQVSRLGSPDVWYKYDALGRRIERNKGIAGPVPLALETSRFVYDGADVVRDLNANLSPAADYLNGAGIDNKLRQTIGGTDSYFVADHLGTTRGLADASGNLATSVGYDSFGNVTSGSASTRYTYTGREIEPDTGLMYYRARWYHPQLGRFISEDPIGLDGGINVYTYVENDALNRTDPSGKIALPFLSLWKWLLGSRKSDCDDCSRDLQLIQNTFRASVDQMTANGQRTWFVRNGLQGTYAELTGTTPYLSCVHQTSVLYLAVRANQYDNHWTFQFEQSTIPFTDWHPHTWLRAISSNPKCPSLKLDPWYNQIGDSHILL